MQRTTTSSGSHRRQARSEAEQEPILELDELVRSVNEVAEQVRDTLSYTFFDIG